MYKFDEPSGLRSIRSEGIIPTDIKTLFAYISDFNNRQKYDTNFDTGRIVRNVDDNYYISYQKYKGKLMISPRDFTCACYKNITADDGIILATTFTDLEKYPKEKGCERADLKIGAFMLKKVDEAKTLFTFISLSDVKLSQMLVNTSLKEVCFNVKYLQEIFKK